MRTCSQVSPQLRPGQELYTIQYTPPTTTYYTAGTLYRTDGPERIWLLQALSSVTLEHLLLISASPTQKL